MLECRVSSVPGSQRQLLMKEESFHLRPASSMATTCFPVYMLLTSNFWPLSWQCSFLLYTSQLPLRCLCLAQLVAWHAFGLVVYTSFTNCYCALVCESGGCFCSGTQHLQATICMIARCILADKPHLNILMQQPAENTRSYVHNNLCT